MTTYHDPYPISLAEVPEPTLLSLIGSQVQDGEDFIQQENTLHARRADSPRTLDVYERMREYPHGLHEDGLFGDCYLSVDDHINVY